MKNTRIKNLFLIVFALLSCPNTPAQDLLSPCPPDGLTEFCFDNSSEYSNCTKTVCLTLNPKPEMAEFFAECDIQAIQNCITIESGESGCIQFPFDKDVISQWFNIEIFIRSHSTQQTAYFLDITIENGYNDIKRGGCRGYTGLKSSDGVNYTITNEFFTGTGG